MHLLECIHLCPIPSAEITVVWLTPKFAWFSNLCTLVLCQVYDQEWSFGFCDIGTGVFSCAPKSNPMYTYRETVPLGRTMLAKYRVNQIVRELGSEWKGTSYDLLSRNCNHFCEELCIRLGVQNLPCKCLCLQLWFGPISLIYIEITFVCLDWKYTLDAQVTLSPRIWDCKPLTSLVLSSPTLYSTRWIQHLEYCS